MDKNTNRKLIYGVAGLAAGASLGALAMYFFDPEGGPRRRAKIRYTSEDLLERRRVADAADDAWDYLYETAEAVR
jgi:hypothetical protein